MKNTAYKTFLFVIIFVVCISSVGWLIKAYNDSNKKLLNGRTIFIDPGHGGKDDGASFGSVVEDSINLKISGYLLEELLSVGANVLISRAGDYDLSSMYSKNKKREDLNKRVNYINYSRPDLFVSIHLNAFNSQNVSGAQTFYQNNDQSKKLAGIIQNLFNLQSSKSKKTKLGDYYILNNTRYTGVLIECGFISNNEERNKLNSVEYQAKIAKIISQGIVDFFYNN